MKVSPAAELAIRGILVLAENGGMNGPVTLARICEERKLPRQYLAKIFGTLARAGLVTPIRGKRGGYELGRPAEEITILDVIEAVEGPIALNFCQHSPPKCDNPRCALRPLWNELQKLLRERLGSVTLAACVDDCRCGLKQSVAEADGSTSTDTSWQGERRVVDPGEGEE